MSSPTEEAPSKPVSLAARIAKAPWRLIGIVLLIIVLSRIDLAKALADFTRIGPAYIAGAVVSFLVLLVVRCLRWRVFTVAIGARQPFWQLAASCNQSIWLGMATPGRIGEFRRAADLSVVRGWSLASSSALVLVELLVDLGAYVALALGGYLWLTLPAPWGLAAAMTILVSACLVLVALGPLSGIALKAAPILRKTPGLSEVLPALDAGLRIGPAVRVLVTTVVALISYVAMVWSLVHPMQADLGALELGTAVGLSGVAGAIPITYFGLGTRDLVLIGFFAQIGKSASDAVALSLCILLAQLIGIFVSLAAVLPLGVAVKREAKQGQRS